MARAASNCFSTWLGRAAGGKKRRQPGAFGSKPASPRTTAIDRRDRWKPNLSWWNSLERGGPRTIRTELRKDLPQIGQQTAKINWLGEISDRPTPEKILPILVKGRARDYHEL